MSIFFKFLKKTSEFFRNLILDWLGLKHRINQIEEKINTLYYFQNALNDITLFPQASDPNLRILQLCDTLFLGIFDKLCKKHNLNYWLDYGTLLGAIRHKGFIPWDDDTDVAMPREDFDKIKCVLKKDLDFLGITLEERRDSPLKGFGLGYNHSSTGIWLDIFPVDSCSGIQDKEIARKDINKIVLTYRQQYFKTKKKSGNSFNKLKQKLFREISHQDTDYLIHPMEWTDPITVSSIQEIYPLKRIPFEGIELNIPNNAISYLIEMYGKDYMKYPTNGVECHGGEGTGRPPLKDWAKINGINMNEVYKRLLDIYDSLA